MGLGTIWTETDVQPERLVPPRRAHARRDHDRGGAGRPAPDFLARGRLPEPGRPVYRLLGCELTYHGSLPGPGDTLRYDIHVDGHAEQDGVRLFFFHSDCRAGGRHHLTVRGRAGRLLHRRGWPPPAWSGIPPPSKDAPPGPWTRRPCGPSRPPGAGGARRLRGGPRRRGLRRRLRAGAQPRAHAPASRAGGCCCSGRSSASTRPSRPWGCVATCGGGAWRQTTGSSPATSRTTRACRAR